MENLGDVLRKERAHRMPKPENRRASIFQRRREPADLRCASSRRSFPHRAVKSSSDAPPSVKLVVDTEQLQFRAERGAVEAQKLGCGGAVAAGVGN